MVNRHGQLGRTSAGAGCVSRVERRSRCGLFVSMPFVRIREDGCSTCARLSSTGSWIRPAFRGAAACPPPRSRPTRIRASTGTARRRPTSKRRRGRGGWCAATPIPGAFSSRQLSTTVNNPTAIRRCAHLDSDARSQVHTTGLGVRGFTPAGAAEFPAETPATPILEGRRLSLNETGAHQLVLPNGTSFWAWA